MEDFSPIWKLNTIKGSKIIVIALLIHFAMISCENTGRKNYQNSKKIELGMDEKQVIRIMGFPNNDSVRRKFVEPTVKAYFYEPPFLSSDGIYIGFDKADKVSLIVRDKGDSESRE